MVTSLCRVIIFFFGWTFTGFWFSVAENHHKTTEKSSLEMKQPHEIASFLEMRRTERFTQQRWTYLARLPVGEIILTSSHHWKSEGFLLRFLQNSAFLFYTSFVWWWFWDILDFHSPHTKDFLQLWIHFHSYFSHTFTKKSSLFFGKTNRQISGDLLRAVPLMDRITVW